MNSTSTVSVTLGEEATEKVEHFTYLLGNVVDTRGWAEADFIATIGKARVAFQSPFPEKQDQDFQYKCQGCSSLQSRDTEDHSDYNKDNTDLCQQLS